MSFTCFSHEVLVDINENISFYQVAFLHFIRSWNLCHKCFNEANIYLATFNWEWENGIRQTMEMREIGVKMLEMMVGMVGLRRTRVGMMGMRGIRVRMQGIRVGMMWMRGIRVGKCGVGNHGGNGWNWGWELGESV